MSACLHSPQPIKGATTQGWRASGPPQDPDPSPLFLGLRPRFGLRPIRPPPPTFASLLRSRTLLFPSCGIRVVCSIDCIGLIVRLYIGKSLTRIRASLACCAPFCTDKHDYCWESFNVTCAQDEVIVMSTARYGRMKFGKCLERDYFVGCSADILSYMDRKCSGRRSCAIDIPDTELHKMQPCPKDLLVYLEADYLCVKGGLSWVYYCS